MARGGVARITAAVAIIVAIVGGGTAVGVALHTSRVQGQAAQAELDRTSRLRAYAHFDDAARDLQRIADTYEAVGVRSAAPVDFPTIDDLYHRAEASYATLDAASTGVLAVGSEDVKGVAERLRAAERRRLDALYVDPAGGVIAGYPAVGPVGERPRERYERIKTDAGRLYDEFVEQVGRERSAR